MKLQVRYQFRQSNHWSSWYDVREVWRDKNWGLAIGLFPDYLGTFYECFYEPREYEVRWIE